MESGSKELPFIILTIVMVVGGVLLAIWMNMMRNRAAQVWKKFSTSQKGFKYVQIRKDFTGGMIKGKLNGIVVNTRIVEKYGIDNTNHYETVYTAKLPIVPPGSVVISAEKLSAKLNKVFVGADIEIGDAAFDKKVMVRSKKEESTKALLADKGLRTTILEVLEEEPSLTVNTNEVKVFHRGIDKTEHKILASFNAVASIAKALSDAQRTIG